LGKKPQGFLKGSRTFRGKRGGEKLNMSPGAEVIKSAESIMERGEAPNMTKQEIITGDIKKLTAIGQRGSYFKAKGDSRTWGESTKRRAG